MAAYGVRGVGIAMPPPAADQPTGYDAYGTGGYGPPTMSPATFMTTAPSSSTGMSVSAAVPGSPYGDFYRPPRAPMAGALFNPYARVSGRGIIVPTSHPYNHWNSGAHPRRKFYVAVFEVLVQAAHIMGLVFALGAISTISDSKWLSYTNFLTVTTIVSAFSLLFFMFVIMLRRNMKMSENKGSQEWPPAPVTAFRAGLSLAFTAIALGFMINLNSLTTTASAFSAQINRAYFFHALAAIVIIIDPVERTVGELY